MKAGQPMLVQIISVQDSKSGSDAKSHRQIDLSIDPILINASYSPEDVTKGMVISAVVESEQDHGYILNLGIENLTGFIKRLEIKDELIIGQVILCTVLKKVNNTLFLTMSITKALTDSQLEFDNLKAGLLLTATVEEVVEMGLITKILGCFEATIDYMHLNLDTPTLVNIEKTYKVGMNVKCRILYVDYEKKQIGLTLLKHLVDLERFSFSKTDSCGDLMQIGDFSEVNVLRVDKSIGILVSLIDTKRLGYVHISKLQDEKTDKIGKNYIECTVHPGRITSLNYCDGVVSMSLQPKILNQQFIRLEDIQVGKLIQGKIIAVEPFGLIVSIADSINGLCPPLHLSDIFLSSPEKVFKIGSITTFKVISKNEIDKKLILTLKKSLVSSKRKDILSYDNVVIGDIAQGLIVSVKPFGLILSFLNDVRAIVPVSELR
jgi:rRNA biogenesis protein RRP5